MVKLYCYNKGCGKMLEKENGTDDEVCIYHSGEPYFHDAYKEWTCCKKKTTDFTEFLNIKGCTEGKHNTVRPLMLEKPKNNNDDKMLETVENIFSKLTSVSINQNNRKDITVSENFPLVNLIPDISPRVLQQFTSIKEKKDIKLSNGAVPIGTICKNSCCGLSYCEGVPEDCVHHPGSAIFHEGLKYWSCCKKMTSDFSKFLEQPGCSVGKHCWFKTDESVQCREDWHQTSTSVVISIFCKNYDPYQSTVSLSPTRLRVYIYFPENMQIFQRDYELFNIVNVETSRLSMLPTKIEIKLTKTVGESWKNITID